MLDDNWLTSNSSDFSVVKVVIVISVFLLLQSIVKYISSLFEKGRSDRDTNEFPEEQQPPIVRSLIDHGRKQRDSFEKHQTVEMERLSKLLEDKDKLLQQKDINIEMIREDYKGKIRQVTECHNKEQQVLREHLEDLKRMKESAEQKCQEDRDCHLAEKNNWKSEKNKMKVEIQQAKEIIQENEEIIMKLQCALEEKKKSFNISSYFSRGNSSRPLQDRHSEYRDTNSMYQYDEKSMKYESNEY